MTAIEQEPGGVTREIDWVDSDPCWDRPLPPGTGEYEFRPLSQEVVG